MSTGSRESVVRTVAFPGRSASVPTARQAAVDAVCDYPDETIQAVSLLVSELVTNAVLHTCGTCMLDIAAEPEVIRVAVSDPSPELPRLWPERGHEFPYGRGLVLVDFLSSAWGCDPHPDGDGKTVWCEIRPDEASSS